MLRILLYLFIVGLTGCNDGKKDSSKVFFAGEIINPSSEYVVLFKNDAVIDSAKIDDRNRFSFSFDSIPEGLYHFSHAPEYQYVYLEGGDSLMVRLNTVDFDESLVFSGKGEEINNFLLDLYLSYETEEKTIYSSYFALNQNEFSKRIDSLRNEKLSNLEDLISESKLSDRANEVARATVDYTYYAYKEKYPFRHRKYTQQKEIEELPDTFYAYRKDLDFNNENLTYLKPYYNFMINHFGNLTYMNCSHKCVIKDNVIKNKLHYNQHKLGLIDSIVESNKELKDNLFRTVAFEYLLKAHDSEENNKVFIEKIHDLSENNKHIGEIDALYQSILSIQPNKKIPAVMVSDTQGKTVSLQDISKNKKAVFYFWTGNDRRHFENMVKRVDELSEHKPEYTFVGINIKTDETKWKGLVETSGLDKANQYRTGNFEEVTKSLIIYPLNKCIITNDAIIVDAFSNMYASF